MISESILLGSGFAFAAAVQPGPLQAFLFSRTTTVGWRRTLPASFAPVISDIPIAIVVIFVLGRLPVVAQYALRAAGGLLLMYFGWMTLRKLRLPRGEAPAANGSAPATVMQAALVNILNPNPYLGWALVLGPALVTAWRADARAAVALLVAFYGTLVIMIAVTIVIFGTARFLSGRAQNALIAISGGVLVILGLYQIAITAMWFRSA